MRKESIVEINDIESFVEFNLDAVAQLNVPATVVFGDFRDGLASMDAAHIVGDFHRYQCSGNGCVGIGVPAVHLIPFEFAEQVAVKSDLGVVVEGHIAVKAEPPSAVLRSPDSSAPMLKPLPRLM